MYGQQLQQVKPFFIIKTSSKVTQPFEERDQLPAGCVFDDDLGMGLMILVSRLVGVGFCVLLYSYFDVLDRHRMGEAEGAYIISYTR